VDFKYFENITLDKNSKAFLLTFWLHSLEEIALQKKKMS
jgi:hypothetical protein